MDFDDLVTLDAHEEGSSCHLVDKHGNITDAFVIVKGPDSHDYRVAKRRQKKAVIELVQQKVDLETYDFYPLDVEFCLAIVSGWGEITKKGKLLEFNQENARALFSKAPAIIERILDFCGNRENFTRG